MCPALHTTYEDAALLQIRVTPGPTGAGSGQQPVTTFNKGDSTKESTALMPHLQSPSVTAKEHPLGIMAASSELCRRVYIYLFYSNATLNFDLCEVWKQQSMTLTYSQLSIN